MDLKDQTVKCYETNCKRFIFSRSSPRPLKLLVTEAKVKRLIRADIKTNRQIHSLRQGIHFNLFCERDDINSK